MVVNIFSFHIFVTNGLPHIINLSSAYLFTIVLYNYEHITNGRSYICIFKAVLVVLLHMYRSY